MQNERLNKGRIIHFNYDALNFSYEFFERTKGNLNEPIDENGTR